MFFFKKTHTVNKFFISARYSDRLKLRNWITWVRDNRNSAHSPKICFALHGTLEDASLRCLGPVDCAVHKLTAWFVLTRAMNSVAVHKLFAWFLLTRPIHTFAVHELLGWFGPTEAVHGVELRLGLGAHHVLTGGPFRPVDAHVGEEPLRRSSTFWLPHDFGLAAAGVCLRDRHGAERGVTPMVLIGRGCRVRLQSGSLNVADWVPVHVFLKAELQIQKHMFTIKDNPVWREGVIRQQLRDWQGAGKGESNCETTFWCAGCCVYKLQAASIEESCKHIFVPWGRKTLGGFGNRFLRKKLK